MEQINLKYPVILVHGIVIKDIFFIKSFTNIDKELTKNGCKVYVSKIDGFGTIETNALMLKEEILKILEKENTQKVNIIAHSKGGLDSKYMIKHLDMGDKVASLTTLCTPHKGSPIATNIMKLPKWLLKFIAFWINFWYRIFGDKHPDALKVGEQLSQSKDIEIETFDVSDKVYCQSYSSKMKKAKDDFVMSVPFTFFHYFEKDKVNDGLVSEESSMFGEYKGDAFDKDNISHSQITGWFVNKKKKEKVYALYISICEDLAKRGF